MSLQIPLNIKTITADAAQFAAADENIRIKGVVLAAGSGAAATLVLHDNAASATGAKLVDLAAVTGDTAAVWFPAGYYLKFSNGVYADIGGSGARATIYYEG